MKKSKNIQNFLLIDWLIPFLIFPTHSLSFDNITHLNDFSSISTNVKLLTPTRGDLAHDGTNPVTLDEPGIYRLTDNMNASSGTDITITATNVTLDLGGATIIGGAIGIDISGDEVMVKNGTIQGTTECGIKITGNYCSLTDIQATSNVIGFELNNATQNILSNCIARNNSECGFYLLSSSNNLLSCCKAHKTHGTSNVHGFKSDCGSSNIFEGCIAEDTQSTSSTPGDLVTGFMFTVTEEKSKIVDCVVADTVATATANAYGILLDSYPSSLNSIQTINSTLQVVRKVKWSPSGRFLLAVGDNTISTTIAEIYKLNNNLAQLVKIAESPVVSMANFRGASWAPNDQFVAGVTGSSATTLKILTFEETPSSASLTYLTTSGAIGISNSVAWMPNSNFIAVGNSDLEIYRFDAEAPSLTQVAIVNPAKDHHALDWRRDGKYLAAGTAPGAGGEIIVYEFDSTDPAVATALTSVASVESTQNIMGVSWSPDGQFLAAVWLSNTTPQLYIYAFDGSSLIQVATGSTEKGLYDASWSPDGRYILVGGTQDSSTDITVFSFDRAAYTLTLLDAYTHGETVYDVSWGKDGKYLAICSDDVGGIDIRMLTFLNFTANNTVKNNTISNTSSVWGTSIGISGSSHGNMIIDNYTYENDVNYAFVTNTFDQDIRNSPKALDNISLPKDRAVYSG